VSSPPPPAVTRIVVIGQTDVGRRACALLVERGIRTVHLSDPSDAELRSALAGDVDGVAVLLRTRGDRRRIGVIDERRHVGSSRGGSHGLLDKHGQPGVLDIDQRGEERLVAHHRACAVITRPEQVGHVQCPG